MADQRRLIRVEGLSNREFLERHAAAGRVGLACGASWVDRRIQRSERRVTGDGAWSRWSHAFFFEGKRADGRHWVVEADVDIGRGQFRNGVQENRIDKFFEAKEYPALAVLDFGLSERQAGEMVSHALDLAADHVRYSYAGLLGTWLHMRKRTLARKSRLHAASRTFCSSFVQLLYASAGIRFAPGVAEENTTPEHISGTAVPHTCWLQASGAEPRCAGLQRGYEGGRPKEG